MTTPHLAFVCKTLTMPKLVLTDDKLIIRLSPAEKLAACRGDVTVNGIAIRGAAIMDKKWWTTLGLRIGTGLPGVIIAGTFIQPKDRAFVSWTRKAGLPLEITLAAKMDSQARGTKYTRIIIGVENAQELADKINDAIVSC